MDQNIPNEAGIHEADPVIAMDLGLDTSASHPSAVPSASHPSVVPSFLAELTRAMQAAAEQMRAHIDADVADDAAEEIERAHARGAIEADELRRLADEDVGGIDAWLAAETERVRGEAARRTDERRTELASHLAKHDSMIAAEVDGVEAAVRDYRTTLDTFFAELKGADDPAELARRAGSLPAPPDLESARGAARADAVARFANGGSKADDTTEPPEIAPSVEVAALERFGAARPEQVEAEGPKPARQQCPSPPRQQCPSRPSPPRPPIHPRTRASVSASWIRLTRLKRKATCRWRRRRPPRNPSPPDRSRPRPPPLGCSGRSRTGRPSRRATGNIGATRAPDRRDRRDFPISRPGSSASVNRSSNSVLAQA